jgi:hypothetical protein
VHCGGFKVNLPYSLSTGCGKLTSFFELSGLKEKGSYLAAPCKTLCHEDVWGEIMLWFSDM